MSSLVYEARGPMTNLTIDQDKLVIGKDFLDDLPIEIRNFISEDNRSEKFLNLLVSSHRLTVISASNSHTPT